MNINNTEEEFEAAEKKMSHDSTYYSGDSKLSTAIFQGLKLIALAIIYHANNTSK